MYNMYILHMFACCLLTNFVATCCRMSDFIHNLKSSSEDYSPIVLIQRIYCNYSHKSARISTASIISR